MSETEITEHHNDPANTIAMLTAVARSLVDAPDEVSVEAIAEGETTILRLRLAPADVGKIIGRQGRTARSLRTILSAVGTKSNQRYVLDIIEYE